MEDIKLKRGFQWLIYDHKKGSLIIDGIDYSEIAKDATVTIKPFQCEVDMHVKLIAKKDESFTESSGN